MELRKYLEKCSNICNIYYSNGSCNKKCPLNKYDCGLPAPELIDECLDTVENFEETAFPYGKCEKCGYEFNSELRNEYDIKFCPKCGKKISR